MHSRLAIDTTLGMTAGPSSSRAHSRQRSESPSRAAGPSHNFHQRGRSVSNASTSSSLSIVSPTSSSTNASTTSLGLPTSRQSSRSPSGSRSPSPNIDETVRLPPEYVLAMHDFQQPDTNMYLSFRAGQVIHVLNRDPGGWWDGELDNRRGWFPSNYVSAQIKNLTEEEPLEMGPSRHGHFHSQSASSTTSWSTIASKKQSSSGHTRAAPRSESLEPEGEDPYCPPLMVPLLHGLSLLQGAVRENRITHFQPSTACIIGCVRSILASTNTLEKTAPILAKYPELANQRKRILTTLASLVAQSRKTSEGGLVGNQQAIEVENMLRLGGHIFSHVRTFLATAVRFGIELPEEQDQDEVRTATPASANSRQYADNDDDDKENDNSATQTPTQYRGRNPNAIVRRPGLRIAGPRSRERPLEPSNTPAVTKSPARIKQEQYLLRDRPQMRHKAEPSVDSISSSSSLSSQESLPHIPAPFPRGPSTAARVMEALRITHDNYLSTIAAFIGHAHSHSRSSYASSTGVLYDLVKEIVDMVCKLLTIVEAVMQHPEVPAQRISGLRSAKDGLYSVTSSLADSVRLLTLSLPPTMSEEAEKQTLLRSATKALKAGADCVTAVKYCLNRSVSDKPFIVNLPAVDNVINDPFTPMKSTMLSNTSANNYRLNGMDDEDLTIQAQTPSPVMRTREISSGSDMSFQSKSSYATSEDTRATSLDESELVPLVIPPTPTDPELTSPTSPVSPTSPSSYAQTDDGTTWEGSTRGHLPVNELEEKIIRGDLPNVPYNQHIPGQDPSMWMFGHDYSLDDVAYNSEGHLVGATMDVLVEKMTPHDSIVDPAFAAIFFMTFRLFSSPTELVDVIISRYNLLPPPGLSNEDLHLWQQRKGIPVRLRVSNFIKMWVESYWRPGVDDVALPALETFTRDGLAVLFQGPAHRIMNLINMRRQSSSNAPNPFSDRTRDPGMQINPPTGGLTPKSDTPPLPIINDKPLKRLRQGDYASVVVTDLDPTELARQLTIKECNLYCAIQPEEILESGQENGTPPVNVRAISSLSTAITGWVAESILNEPDLKKRTQLVKFFVKVAHRATELHNFSTSRSILAALDSSVISRLRQTWAGLSAKYKNQLEALRRLADHSRNYHEYRSKLRNTAPPAVPFLGLYLTDVTFCREGNPSHRASPTNPSKMLINFNKYHKLARIVQDMQRFQVAYHLLSVDPLQDYLTVALENARHHGDLQDLYRRSLLVEPKNKADNPPPSDMRQLFNWATRSQSQAASSS